MEDKKIQNEIKNQSQNQSQNQIQNLEKLVIREELNLSKLPIFLPSHTKKKSLTIKKRLENEKQMVIVGIIKDADDNNQEVGIFNIFDYKIYLFLIYKYKQLANKHDNIEFSINEIIKFLELKTNGKLTQKIKNSLERLAKIPIDFSSFTLKKNRDYIRVKHIVHIIKNLSLLDAKQGKNKKNKSFCKFHEYITDNLDFNYTKPTLFNQLNQLKSEYAIILYRYLDICLSTCNVIRKTWKQLARELYMPYQMNSKIKQYLIPALEELKGKQISTGLISDFKTEKTEVFIFKKTIAQIENNKFDNDGFNVKLQKKLKLQYGKNAVERTKSRVLAKKSTIGNIDAFLIKSLENGWNLEETEDEKEKEKKEQQKKLELDKKRKEAKEQQKREERQKEEEKYLNMFENFNEQQKELLTSAKKLSSEDKIN